MFPRYGDAWLAKGVALLDAGRPHEAVRAFETLLRADSTFTHLGRWMLAAHARARRYGAGPVFEGFLVGDKVRFRVDQPGFWARHDTAEVLGLGSPLGPILIKLDKEPRTVHTQGTHFEKIASADEAARAVTDQGAGTHPEDYYATLGVCMDFTAAEVKQAFRAMSRANHPDKGGSTARFQAIATAHDVLSDHQRRSAYDAGVDLSRHPAHPDGDEWTLKSEIEKRYV
jgi:hypothetical protein